MLPGDPESSNLFHGGLRLFFAGETGPMLGSVMTPRVFGLFSVMKILGVIRSISTMGVDTSDYTAEQRYPTQRREKRVDGERQKACACVGAGELF